MSNKLQQAKQHTGKEHDDQHIFISYQRDSRETVLKVRDYLQSKGFKTWVDEDDMSGSVIESMATAVEKAFAVLVCISEKYKESATCRNEAEYVYRLGKPVIPLRLQEKYQPDGWLGIVIGSKLVFDVSKPEKFDISMKNVMDSLKNIKMD